MLTGIKIRTIVGPGGKRTHAAAYDLKTKDAFLVCREPKRRYMGAVVDPTPPTPDNITCKQCKKRMEGPAHE